MVKAKMKKSSIIFLVCVSAVLAVAVASCRRSEPEKTAGPVAKPGSSVASSVEPSASNQPVPEASLMRIIAPVRLSSELGDALDAEVVQAREILEKFDKGGFKYGLWAVSDLPAAKDIPRWVETCLRSFPSQAIVAIDTPLGEPLPEESLKLFLQSLKSSTSVHSILLNYTHLSNCSAAADTGEALSALTKRMTLVRSVVGEMQVWLLLEDCEKNGDRIPVWTDALAKLVDGYYLNRQHDVRMSREDWFMEYGQLLAHDGKPVIRAGLVYTTANPRQGIFDEIAKQYRRRIEEYEAWVIAQQYSGYSRETGGSVPNALNPNATFVEERKEIVCQ